MCGGAGAGGGEVRSVLPAAAAAGKSSDGGCDDGRRSSVVDGGGGGGMGGRIKCDDVVVIAWRDRCRQMSKQRKGQLSSCQVVTGYFYLTLLVFLD